MTDEEKLLRIEALTEMFLGYGQPVNEDRIRYYGNCTKHVPLEVFHQACRNAAIQNDSSWPPGPGSIVAAALSLSPGPLNPGQPRSFPRWYRKALSERVSEEKPREIGARGAVESITCTAESIYRDKAAGS